jgi:SAM-dependent methyltransferase
MEYVGDELELFAEALNWKTYLSRQMAPYIGGRVLEVGAGIGKNIPLLFNDRVSHWLALEPDSRLAATILDDPGQIPFRQRTEVRVGTTNDLSDNETYNTILYIDVLEHIPDDGDEIVRAARHLAPGGHLIVLSPAHQFLFSPFDQAIGHVRRYDRRTLPALTPDGLRTAMVKMLDSAGFFLSLGNRLAMRSSMPTPGQIRLWDRVFVPISRVLDTVTAFRFGKSILVVWRSEGSAA